MEDILNYLNKTSITNFCRYINKNKPLKGRLYWFIRMLQSDGYFYDVDTKKYITDITEITDRLFIRYRNVGKKTLAQFKELRAEYLENINNITFDKIPCTPETLRLQIDTLLASERPKINRREALKTILSCIDLTSLNGNDTETTITTLCQKARLLSVAAVCVYPTFVELAKQRLTGGEVRVATVIGGFPSGQMPLYLKLSEATYAIAQGADEIDMVISRGKFLEGKYEETGKEIAAVKQLCGKKILKVILETGELQTPDNIRKATEIAILSGADFIKTSTGKTTPAATLETSWGIMEIIAEHYQQTHTQIGFKPAGGITNLDQAIDYYIILNHLLGKKWMNKNYFRIGASQLADKLRYENSKLKD